MARKKKEETVAESAAEAEVGARKLLTMDSGAVYEIVSQDGKYYYCGPVRFRKGNPHIRSVRKEEGE